MILVSKHLLTAGDIIACDRGHFLHYTTILYCKDDYDYVCLDFGACQDVNTLGVATRRLLSQVAGSSRVRIHNRYSMTDR